MDLIYNQCMIATAFVLHADFLPCSGSLPSFRSTTRRAKTQQSYHDDDDISEDDEYYCEC